MPKYRPIFDLAIFFRRFLSPKLKKLQFKLAFNRKLHLDYYFMTIYMSIHLFNFHPQITE